jgi:hypothetical protein
MKIRIVKMMMLWFVCTQYLQGQAAGPSGFQDTRLGMSLVEFVAKHPAPAPKYYGERPNPLPGQAVCRSTSPTITKCQFDTSYTQVPLRVITVFVNAQLVMIEVEPPSGSWVCFEPPPTSDPARASYLSQCQEYPPLLRALTDTFGSATILVSPKAQELRAMRWENDSSVAEFQVHLCGPWSRTGWEGNYQEIVEGKYCGQDDDLTYAQPIMLYFHKGLIK